LFGAVTYAWGSLVDAWWCLRVQARRARVRSAAEPDAGAWATITAVAMLAVTAMGAAGLAVDGSGQVRGAQRASWVAAEAARDAADQLVGTEAMDGAWRTDPVRARQVVQERVQVANTGTDDRLVVKDVQIDGLTVTVTLTGTYTTIFLGLFGVGELRYTMTQSATAVPAFDGQEVPWEHVASSPVKVQAGPTARVVCRDWR